MPNWSGDSPRIIESIVAKTGLSVEEVTRLVAACRDAVDELIADDFSIAAPPLLYATASDPVFAALSILTYAWRL